MAVLCMLYKIRCNPIHTLYGALPGPYVPVQVTRGALVAHRYTSARLHYAPHSTAGSFSISVEWSLWPCHYEVGLAGSKSKANTFFSAARSVFTSYCFPLLYFYSKGWYCRAGVFELIGCQPYQAHARHSGKAVPTFFNNNNKNNNRNLWSGQCLATICT